MSQLKRAIDLLGGQAATARIFGIKQQAIHLWFKRKIPAERVPLLVNAVYEATGERIHPADLRPDLPLLFPREDHSSSTSTTA